MMLHVSSQRWKIRIWIGLGEPRGFYFNIYFFKLQQRRETAGDDTDIPLFQTWLVCLEDTCWILSLCVSKGRKRGGCSGGRLPGPSREGARDSSPWSDPWKKVQLDVSVPSVP